MTKFLNIKDVKQKLKDYPDRQKRIILMICVLIGVLMMTFSGLTGESRKKYKKYSEENFNVGRYEEDLEKRLLDLVERIEGVGRAKIMITLENSIEYIYAQEKREKTDRINDYHDQAPFKVQERNDAERKLMLVDGPNGKRQALVKTEIQPKVKGVVVVCQGGDKPLVNQQVTNVIMTVLNISSNRVFVTKSFN